ncbi:MAG TPA: phosphatidylserine decarboxylase family protein [bacterium]|nr:phosphatidylserine decarboxylase family protein [bacterium]HPG45321.1 phosphatidylserine decarboxylase family protein [bacterium]HPM98960.1 phosphatidylserine decarboxylase family protein [bacterium]
MIISKEGWGLLSVLAVFILLFAYLGFYHRNSWMVFLFVLTVALFLLVAYFFRDPQRTTPSDPLAIVSPADGKVVAVDRIEEDRYIDGSAQRVAIFLSIFDVHINTIPFGGQVDFLDYKRGRFFPAFREEAAAANQHVFIGLMTPYGKLAFKQIAGAVARRIVCRLRMDDEVKTGHKFGMIKFGSRVEIYMPDWATPTVKVGDRVRAGESVIGRANEK